VSAILRWFVFCRNIVRSLWFQSIFCLAYFLWGLAALPLLVAPKKELWRFTVLGSVYLRNLLRVAGLRIEIRGLNNIPKSGCIIAMKHQSSLETILLLDYFQDPAFVLKRELMWIPFFGWFANKVARVIPVKRNQRAPKAALKMLNRVRQAINMGRQVVIFPEGTRRPVGSKPLYKRGIGYLYKRIGSPVIPVALNTGLFWPRQTLKRYPGKAVIEFLPAIPPGLQTGNFQEILVKSIEDVSNKLAVEALTSTNPPPVPSTWSGSQ